MAEQPTTGGIPNMPFDDYHDFNHYWNIELCVQRCINASGEAAGYIMAVDQFEATLISDLDDKLYSEVKHLSDLQQNTLGEQSRKIEAQFRLAREKFRLLYGFMKQGKVSKAVLAIGRPKCHKCGELILWNKKERAEARQKLRAMEDVAVPEE